MIAAWALLFSSVAWLKYRSFSFQDFDLAIINQTFWNTAHGRIVAALPGDSTILNGGHVFLVIFLLTPLYALFPGPLTLLYLQAGALALGAWPVYLMARDRISPLFGALFAAVYLLYPALSYVVLFEFHLIALATPLLLWVFYFYQRRRFGLFCLLVALALSCREDVSIPVFALGCFLLIETIKRPAGERRIHLRWALVALLGGALWFLACVGYIQPHFRPSGPAPTDPVQGWYSWMGNTPGEMLRTLLLHPGKVLRVILMPPKLVYLRDLLLPVAFTPLLAPAHLVMLAISLAEGLLSQRFTHFSIRYQYSSIVTPVVFFAAIAGAARLFHWRRGRAGWLGAALIGCAAVASAVFGPFLNLPAGMRLWRMTEEDGVRQALVEMIPPQVPVVATFAFTPKLSMRPLLFYFYHVSSVASHPAFAVNIPEIQANAEYALIDFNDWLTFYDFYTPGGDRSVREFLEQGEWGVEATVDSLALFRKHSSDVFRLVEPRPPVPLKRRLNARAAPGLTLVGYEIAENEWQGRKVLDLSCDLRAEQKLAEEFLLNPIFFLAGQPVFEQPLFAPVRILPTTRWEPGTTYRQRCRILIPEDAPRGSYELRLALEVRKPVMTPEGPQWKVWRGVIARQDEAFIKS